MPRLLSSGEQRVEGNRASSESFDFSAAHRPPHRVRKAATEIQLGETRSEFGGAAGGFFLSFGSSFFV